MCDFAILHETRSALACTQRASRVSTSSHAETNEGFGSAEAVWYEFCFFELPKIIKQLVPDVLRNRKMACLSRGAVVCSCSFCRFGGVSLEGQE